MRSTAARREEHRVTWTRAADTLAWVRPDLSQRLLPFAAVVALVALVWRPSWLGVAGGDLRVQLTFGLLGFVVPAVYIAAVLTAAVVTSRELPARARALLVLVYPTMHICWGAGFLQSVMTYRQRGLP